jgi:DMSO reductase anchor subunit
VLTQLSVGAFTASQIVISSGGSDSLTGLLPWHAATSLGLGLLALGASLFHLGRPLYAFRAFIGLRHSWLSREIVAFGAFAKLAIAYAALLWLKDWLPGWANQQTPLVAWGVVGSGLTGVFCSVMIYVATQLGTATLGAVMAVVGQAGSELLQLSQMLTRAVLLIGVAKLSFELSLFRHLLSPHLTTLGRSAHLHLGPLRGVTIARYLLGIAGAIVLPVWLLRSPSSAAGMSVAILVLLTAGEFLERYLYFAAVAAPRMPGAVRT